ncbi:unnamed protein product [Clonostachys rosea f. rosea IK726]|uniref:Uncharacterized protein n=1 Tax=Clonostachys rosea f. rosea IK726 TaxID=1349383 RepID=A0ACA9UDF7_BIOOC|nr:unnamed protein product [Clonostachys rosea f. rosea IK726]
MDSHTADESPTLAIVSTDGSTKAVEAAKSQPALLREALIDALSLIPLNDSDLSRIQAQEKFRRSITAERDTTPYRLQTVFAACKSGDIDKTSLEARFYEYGGVRALAALAAAMSDDKQVVPLLQMLSNDALRSLLVSIKKIEPHSDLVFLTERIRRKKQRPSSKRTTLAGPRQRRKQPAATQSNTTLQTLVSMSEPPEPIERHLVKESEQKCPSTNTTASGATVQPQEQSVDTLADRSFLPEVESLLAEDSNGMYQFATADYSGPSDEMTQFAIPHLFSYSSDVE